MGCIPYFAASTPNEDDQLEEEVPTDDIADYKKVDEGLSSEVPNYNEEEVDYVDFLSVGDILNSPNNDLGEFYSDEKNYIFTRETIVDSFLNIFMARGTEKERKKYDKVEYLPSDVQGFNDKHRDMPMMKSIAFIVVCYLVLILRKGEWNELTRYPNDHGKNQPNSRSNSL